MRNKENSLFFRALVLAFATIAGAVFASEADVFRNPTAGFEVTKPAGWQYATADFTQKNLKSTKLNSEEMHAAMMKYATAPMVA